jgi:hypothetical protein
MLVVRSSRVDCRNFTEVDYSPDLGPIVVVLPGVIDLALEVATIDIVVSTEVAVAPVDIASIVVAKEVVVGIHPHIDPEREVGLLHKG